MEARSIWRPAAAELLGTLALVFIGAGSIVTMNKFFPGGDGGNLVGIALAHGLTIAVMVTALGHISGGHFNPAVTIAALFTRRLRIETGVAYIAAQIAGATIGAALLVAALPAPWWNPDAVSLGLPQPNGELASSPAKVVLIEAVLTFFLVLVVFGVGIDSRNKSNVVAGLAIGFTVALDILMGGPITGAAMNPARAFGPALVIKDFDHQHLYWIGPILGGILAGLLYDQVFMGRRPKDEPEAGASSPRSHSKNT